MAGKRILEQAVAVVMRSRQGIWPSRQKPEGLGWGFFVWFGVFFLCGCGFFFLEVTKFGYGWETEKMKWNSMIPPSTDPLPAPSWLTGSWCAMIKCRYYSFPTFFCSFLKARKYGVANLISLLSCPDHFPCSHLHKSNCRCHEVVN